MERKRELAWQYRCRVCSRELVVYVQLVDAPFCSRCNQPMVQEVSPSPSEAKPAAAEAAHLHSHFPGHAQGCPVVSAPSDMASNPF